MAQETTNFVDKLIDDEGIKFSVSLDLSPDIYLKLGVVIVLAILVGTTGSILIKNAFKKA